MKTGHVIALAGKGLLILLFVAAFWWRVDTLGRVPVIDADEAFYGLMASRLLHGEPAGNFVVSGHLLNPFYLALEFPLVLTARPSPWVLRAPAAASGVLAVVLAYVLGSRVLGRPTALIAATVLAALPIAVMYSRVGHEYSQIPLAGVVVLYFALKPSVRGLVLAVLASFLIHPITVFMIPVALPVLVARLIQTHNGDPARLRRMLLTYGSAAAVGGLGVGAVLLRHPVVQQRLQAGAPMSWVTFFTALERFLLDEYAIGSESALWWHRRLFWGTILVVADLGVRRLVRDRQWERLALAAGLAVSLTAFHVITGPKLLLDAGPNRYGVVFVVPIALTFACFAQSLFAGAAGSGVAPRLAIVRFALLLAVGWGMLWSVKTHHLDSSAGPNVSLWRVRTALEDPWGRSLSLILRDARARAGGGKVTDCEIIGQEFWATQPLSFLASARPGVNVRTLVSTDDLDRNFRGDGDILNRRRHEMAESLRHGAYVVTALGLPAHLGGKVVETAIAAEFAPGEVHRWVVPTTNGVPLLSVYRLEHRAPVTAAGDGGSSRR